MDNKQLAQKYIELVGGKENIKSVAHCVTRLRLKLYDESKADDKAVEAIEQTQGLIKKGGQYQIVLGPGFVDKIYDEVVSEVNIPNGSGDDQEDENIGIFNKFIDLISSIFTPVLGILAASGMIKGFNVLFSVLGLYAMDSNTYKVLESIGDTFFYFLPVFLGFYAMKKFGGTPMLGATLGAVLVYPFFAGLAGAEPISTLFAGTSYQLNVQSSIFGIPLIMPMSGYGSSVIPIIAITYVGSKVEKLIKKYSPDTISLFIVPMTVLLITSVVGLLVVGPILTVLTSIIAITFKSLLAFSPALYGALLAGTWQLLVMFGLHWAIVPLGYMEFGEFAAGNIDKIQIMAAVAVVSFSQVGVLGAIIVKTRQEKLKKLAVPAFITAIFGITEPALYGITLKRKKIFAMTCITSAISGGFLSMLNVGAYNMGGLGIFTIPNYLNPNISSFSGQTDFIIVIIAILLNTVLSFTAAYFMFNDTTDIDNQHSIGLVTPVVGTIVPLEDIDDKVFSSQTMGQTTAIYPHHKEIYAPFDGEIGAVYPTKHAIGIKSTDGVEVLIHMGIDTVELDGFGFEVFVEKGQEVKMDEKIATIDYRAIVEKGYDPTVIVIVLDNNNQEFVLGREPGENIGKMDELLKLA